MPMTLVSGKLRYMRIFGEVHEGGGVKLDFLATNFRLRWFEFKKCVKTNKHITCTWYTHTVNVQNVHHCL